jgi:DNA-binding winged helix-turn-helix (wHTH) protein
MQTLTARKLRFSDLELDKARRLLLRNYEPIPLNAKAFDLLMVLVEHRGQVLSKDELLDRVWPGQFVEEGNLKVHISALRKALGERKDEHRFIITIPGRGYSFVADVEETGNGDIVIEKHSLSRISIDGSVEEAETPSTDAPAYPLQQRASEARFRWDRLLFALFAVFFVGSAGVAGYLIINRNEDAKAGIIRSQIRRLTTKGNISFAALSPDGKLFAYALKELERNSLWLGFVEGGSDLMVRPSETGRYNDLAFSADGNDILFTFSGADSRESVLYRMPVSGGPREKIRSGVVSFCVSPDGRSYAFGRTNAENRSRELVVGQLDGSEEHVVTSFPIVSSFGSESISWSPDGNAIAVGAKTDDQKRRDEVFIVQVTDGSVRRLTNYGWKEVIKTAWIDDGSGLLLVAQEKDSHTSVSYSQIWHVTFPEGEIRQLTHDLSSYRSVLDASKDAFLSVELRQTNNIWVAPSDDLGQARQVTFGTSKPGYLGDES